MKRIILPLFAAFVAVVLASYVTTYFLRSELVPVTVGYGTGLSGEEPPMVPDLYRFYATEFEVTLFAPAASVESLLCRKCVKAAVDPESEYQ